MSLDNLVGISLEVIEPDANSIMRLLAAARRNIADSKIKGISAENQFDVAYKAIMQIANLALQASGYRTLTSKPGHHATMLQSLGQTLGTDRETLIVLDALRKQRNVADYSGDLVPTSAVAECIRMAELLVSEVDVWLKKEKPHLIN